MPYEASISGLHINVFPVIAQEQSKQGTLEGINYLDNPVTRSLNCSIPVASIPQAWAVVRNTGDGMFSFFKSGPSALLSQFVLCPKAINVNVLLRCELDFRRH